MKPLINIVALLLLSGCSIEKPHVCTWQGGLPEIVVVEQFTTNCVPRDSWTKLEESAFSDTYGLEMLAYYSETSGALSVTLDKDTKYTWRIIGIDHPIILMKREGESKRESKPKNQP